MADVDSQGGPSHMLGRMWAMMEDVSDGKTKAHGRRLRGGREKMVLTPPSSKSSTVKHPNTKSSRKITLPCFPQHLTSPDVCLSQSACSPSKRPLIRVSRQHQQHSPRSHYLRDTAAIPPASSLLCLVKFCNLSFTYIALLP